MRLCEINAYNCPEMFIDPPDSDIICHCSKCGGEIYRDEPTVIEGGKKMCVDCFRDRIKEILRDSPSIVAECLGMRYKEGEIE